MNRQQLFFKNAIDIINSQIRLLKEAGIEIHDRENFDQCLDYVRYSQASDCVTLYLCDAEYIEDLEHEALNEIRNEHKFNKAI